MALVYPRLEFKELKLSKREQLLLLEIGKDQIDTASSFVDYMHENYGLSKSSVWYCLNRLKEYGIAEFANKAEQGKPLRLTKLGLSQLAKYGNGKNAILEEFSNLFLNRSDKNDTGRYQGSYVGNGTYTL